MVEAEEVPPGESGQSISLREGRVADRLRHLGFTLDWVAGSSGDLTGAAVFTQALADWRVTRRVLSDDSGQAVGTLCLFHPQAGVDLQDILDRATTARKRLAVLSPREAEILALVSQGLTNRVAAKRASISEKTVEKHRANIMRKLEVSTVADLIRRVTEASLLQENEATGKASE